MITRKETLEKATQIVCNDREATYGSPEDNFKLISSLWGTYLGMEITSKDVAVMMILFKIARISTGNPKADNWIDLAGYAACGAELQCKI